MKIESTEFVNEDALNNPDSGFKGYNGYYWTSINEPFHTEAVNWILSQENIDWSFFTSKENDFMGIGCSCSNKKHPSGEPMYTCYFASARNIKAKDWYEWLPNPFIYIWDYSEAPLGTYRDGEDVYPAMRREFQCFK